ARAKILPGGVLEHDRAFAIFDGEGRFVNGKRDAKVHLLRSVFDLNAGRVTLRSRGSGAPARFHLHHEREKLERWLSDYFGFPARLFQNDVDGFPDDTEASGPTVVSEGTLNEIASWFGGLGEHDMRLRFRANLEITGAPVFWEDRLFGDPGTVMAFQIGDVRMEGVRPCRRCVVPTRDPVTSEIYPEFQKTFMEKRRETLSPSAAVSRFNHFYRLCVNTRIPASESGKFVKVGDEVKIIGSKQF
ncbi:MAG TPA: hypothetical protein VI382_10095, partial [Candidatus Manganitrophaceae bacterium]|nr:hypothetical protein [Candidatus Manganitrophaceae bacterium]